MSSASQYPAASSNILSHDGDEAETDRARERGRGRLSIKNEGEEEEYYQRVIAGPSNARPTSRNGVSARDAGPSLVVGGTSAGGTLAAGLVMKARDRRLGKPTGGSGEYSASDLDDKRERERVSRLQRGLSMEERESRRTKTSVAAPIAGGSGISPTGVSNPAIPLRTPHTRKQTQNSGTTAGRGTTPTTADSIAIAEKAQLASSTGRTLRGTSMKRARSPSTGPREGMIERVPAAKYAGVLPPSNPRTQPRLRRDQQQNYLAQHGVNVHDFAQQQHQSHLQYQQPAYSQPLYPTTGPNVAGQPQYAPNGTLLSGSATAPAPVVVNGHAQNLLPQAVQIMQTDAPGNSSSTSSIADNSSSSIVVCYSV